MRSDFSRLSGVYTCLLCSLTLVVSACQIQEPLISELDTTAGLQAGEAVIVIEDEDRMDGDVAGIDLGGVEEAGAEGAGVNMAGMDVVDMDVVDMDVVDMTEISDVMDMMVIDAEVVEEEPPRMGSGDTMPLTCMGDYCPSARMSFMELPDSIETALLGGCQLQGISHGSSLNNLFDLIGNGSINDFVQPDDEGNISLIILNHLVGWEFEETGNEAADLTSQFYTGRLIEDESFVIEPSSLDSSGTPYISFPNTTMINTLYQTPRDDFMLTIPLAGIPFELRLSYTDISGFISVDEVGFQMREGVINGYLTEETILSLVSDISQVCNLAGAPAICDFLSGFLSGIPETDAALLIGLLGGYDTLVSEEDDLSPCAGTPECNALSVCLFVEMNSVTITGIDD